MEQQSHRYLFTWIDIDEQSTWEKVHKLFLLHNFRFVIYPYLFPGPNINSG